MLSFKRFVMISVLLVLLEISVVYGLVCYDCNGIQATSQCHTVVTCPADNVCSTEVSSDGNNTISVVMGCKHKQQCQPISTTQMPTQPVSSNSQSSSSILCSNCCSTSACNGVLCSTVAHTGTGSNQCEDDLVFDCAYVSTSFDICSDIDHAKNVCKRFCNLCDLVDGGWAIWSAWSACDTSCGNGSTIRTRTCTNPRPEHGGSDCKGINKQSSTCNPQDCPVHGGWTSWSPWGSCSNTCGMGLQRRDRSCSNPYPALFGDHCFGDDKVYRACFERACVDGGWSDWSNWGTCSATCNGGLMTRTRTCTNPQPSQFGRMCLGTDSDKQICSTRNCPAKQVAFLVNTPTGTLVNSATPTFSTMVMNIGGSYNESTGNFRSPVAGLYSFSLTLQAWKRTDSPEIYCWIRKNTANIALVDTFEGAHDSSSISAFIYLSISDIVNLSCSGWDQLLHSQHSAFTGALIRAD